MPAADHLRVHLRARCSGCCSTACCCAGWPRRRCTPGSSAPSACSSRCPTWCSGWSSRVGNDVLGPRAARQHRPPTKGGSAPGVGPTPAHVYHPLHGVALNSDQLAVFVVAAVAAVGLWFVLRRTRVGLEMRAVVDREQPRRPARASTRPRTSASRLGADDAARRARRRAHRPAVQPQRRHLHPRRARLARRGRARRAAFAADRVRRRPAARRRAEPRRRLQRHDPPEVHRQPDRAALGGAVPPRARPRPGRSAGTAAGGRARSPTSGRRPTTATGCRRWRRRLPWAIFVVALVGVSRCSGSTSRGCGPTPTTRR